MNRILCCCLLLLCTYTWRCEAQTPNTVWESGKGSKKKAKDKLKKEKTKATDFKKHLQEWGLDENYNQGILVGGKLNTNGWSGCCYYQKRTGKTSSNIWQVSFSEIKHEKQLKIKSSGNSFPQLGTPSAFVFGKIDNFYTLNIGLMRERVLLPAVVNDNLTISYRYGGGFSLGMLKPYYLRLAYTDSATGEPYLKEEKYGSGNADVFLNSGAILGASKWSKSLGQIIYVPGAFLEAAVVIEPAKNKSFVQVITIGGNFSLYTRKMPIMAELKAYPWQACFFAGLALGTRWK